MTLLKKAFIQKITKIATIRSPYGDIIPDPNGNNIILYCRFRVIGETVRVNNREELRSDQAMVWFDPVTNIQINDILLYESRYWEVIRINEARRMSRGTDIQFLKVWVAAHDMVS